MAIMIPVKKLTALCDPFRQLPWGVRVTKRQVQKALFDRRLAKNPGTDDHAGRIAYFVENESLEAISIDVGVPVLGFCPGWIVPDGNHRLAAAIFAGRLEILAVVSGQLDYAEALLGVNCEEGGLK
jgi:hypothetical protein